MLGNKDVVASIAVKDLEVARSFYVDTLGLLEDSGANVVSDELMLLRSGSTLFSVYQSQYAGTNKATALTWPVGDELDDIVGALRANGITFEHYDMPDTTREGDIHVSGDFRGAWFKDPDGNILNVVNM